MCKGVGVTLCLLQTHFSFWYMDSGCVKWLLQEKNRNTVVPVLFYISWFCWSSQYTLQILLFSVNTNVYCMVMESILFITNKGQDGLPNTERCTGQSHLAIIVTGYFMQTQFHCCFT